MIIENSLIFSVQWQPGIYHYSNEGIISWFDFALQLKKLSGSLCKINPVSTPPHRTEAKRPAYSVLDKTKIQQVFGCSIKNWKDSLGDCLLKLKNPI